MRVVVVTKPAPIVSLDEAKRHLRVDFDDDDTIITSFIQAATAHMEGKPNGWLGRSLGIQTLDWTSHCFGHCRELRLPYPPVIDIASVTYLDSDGAVKTLAADQYSVVGDYICLKPSASWPSLGAYADAARIRYRAGFAVLQDVTLVNDVPEPLRVAILLHVGLLYENRESAFDVANLVQLPMGYEALAGSYRNYS